MKEDIRSALIAFEYCSGFCPGPPTFLAFLGCSPVGDDDIGIIYMDVIIYFLSFLMSPESFLTHS